MSSNGLRQTKNRLRYFELKSAIVLLSLCPALLILVFPVSVHPQEHFSDYRPEPSGNVSAIAHGFSGTRSDMRNASMEMNDWEIRIGCDAIQRLVEAGSHYILWNVFSGSVLKYGTQARDTIELDLAPNSHSANVSFIRRPGSEGPLRYGEPVAMNLQPGGYLKYDTERPGIDLHWSDTPVYQWQITGRRSGEPVRTAVKVGLYNSSRRDYLVYCDRPPAKGVDLRWIEGDCDSRP